MFISVLHILPIDQVDILDDVSSINILIVCISELITMNSIGFLQFSSYQSNHNHLTLNYGITQAVKNSLKDCSQMTDNAWEKKGRADPIVNVFIMTFVPDVQLLTIVVADILVEIKCSSFFYHSVGG